MALKEFDLIIEPKHAAKNYWRDIWKYRELFFFLAWRDVLVRYKQTVIGVAWSVLRPFLTMLVFTFVFGNLAKLPSGGVPYPILVYSAMLPWQFFANSLTESSSSLIENANLLTKVYFPRLIVPASSVIVSLIDFGISAIVMAGMMVYFQFVPGIFIFTLPLFLMLALFTALGAGLWFAALNVKYRDFRYIVPFIVQFGLYISPVGFSSNIIPENLRFVYSLNPMVGVIDGFRWAILGKASPIYWPGFLISIALMLVLLITGIIHFRKVERVFADVV